MMPPRLSHDAPAALPSCRRHGIAFLMSLINGLCDKWERVFAPGVVCRINMGRGPTSQRCLLPAMTRWRWWYAGCG